MIIIRDTSYFLFLGKSYIVYLIIYYMKRGILLIVLLLIKIGITTAVPVSSGNISEPWGNSAETFATPENELRPNANQNDCPTDDYWNDYDCKCSGSTVKCPISGGREMIVYAGKSGNKIIQVKGVNVSTNVTLYYHLGGLIGKFKDGVKNFNKMPGDVESLVINTKLGIASNEATSEKMSETIKKTDCNCEIILKDDAVYYVKTTKKARLFGIFPIEQNMNIQIDAVGFKELKIEKPWWGFLASDSN
jgi:hypothetical protein